MRVPDGQVLVPVWVLQALLTLTLDRLARAPVLVHRAGPLGVVVCPPPGG